MERNIGTSDGQDIATALHDLTELQAYVKCLQPLVIAYIWSMVAYSADISDTITHFLCLFCLFTMCSALCQVHDNKVHHSSVPS